MNFQQLLAKARRWFRRESERLGCDIHRSVLRSVRLQHQKQEGYRVITCGAFSLENLWNETGEDRQQIKVFLERISGGLKKCAFVAEHPTLRVRRMNIASMPESDLLEAIRWNFREHIDCPIEKYAVGYTSLAKYHEKGQLALMAYGISEEAIQQYVKLAKEVGFKLVSLEPPATALLAAFHLNQLLVQDRFSICVLLSEEETYCIVMTTGVVLFSRPLTGLHLKAFIETIAREKNIEEAHANKVFDEWLRGGSGSGDSAYDLVTIAGTFLRQLAIETQRSLDAFCIMYGVESVHDLYICGKGVQFPKLKEHMEHSLGMDVHIFDPFLRLPLPQEMEIMELQERSTYAVAVGLSVI